MKARLKTKEELLADGVDESKITYPFPFGENVDVLKVKDQKFDYADAAGWHYEKEWLEFIDEEIEADQIDKVNEILNKALEKKVEKELGLKCEIKKPEAKPTPLIEPGSLKIGKELGLKFDTDKPKMHLLADFGQALNEVSRLATFGAEKYGESNWTKLEDGEKRCTSAMLRHFFKEKTDVVDEETGLLHATATAWNALARLEFILRDNENE